MTSYTTVIITWVYMPRDLIEKPSSYRILRHERVHMRDCIQTGILPFVLSYLFIFPAVITMRSYWEMRAYKETMREEYERLGYVPDSLVQHIETQFVSSSYFWMCPFPAYVKKWVEKERNRINSESARTQFKN